MCFYQYNVIVTNRLYYVIGWCLPLLMTLAWAIVTANYVETECWTGYSWTPYYWIVEAPRLTIIAVCKIIITVNKIYTFIELDTHHIISIHFTTI